MSALRKIRCGFWSREITRAHPNLVLSICCMSLLLVSMDTTIVNVALPVIQRDLHASLSSLQWIIDAYTLVVASLLMFSGATSDRFGRRRVFQIGLVLFTVGSLLCSLAPTIGALILFRAVQGLGGSMLNPVALSIVANTFTEAKARARAIGIWGAVAGVALALGPLAGGALTEAAGWRSIFWINLPLGIAAIVLAALYVPESKSPHPRDYDPVGQILVFSILVSVTYAIIEGPRDGWSSATILALFAAACVMSGIFLLYEARRRHPLLDLRFFRSAPFASATVLALCVFATFAGFLFLNALYLEHVRHFSAFQTGVCSLPIAIMMTICAPLSGRMVAHQGPRPSLLIAGISFTTSTFMLTQLSSSTTLPLLIAAYAFLGVGLGMVNPAITNSAVAGMPRAQAGVAAATASTGRQVGAALGVAIAGTVVNASQGQGEHFTRATHPIWWMMTGCGVITFIVGWASTSRWAHTSANRVAHLLDASSDLEIL